MLSRTPADRETAGQGNALEQAIRIAQWRLIPLLLLLYVIAFLDRANIGFARQALQANAGISTAAYALGAGLFFITYALLEVPSNLLLQRVGARAWLCRIMVGWGLVSMATLFVRGPASFYVLRLLLGAAEAGLYITYWFPIRSRARILGLFYFGAPLALIFGGPISGVLLQMPTVLALQGWQWMFLVEGMVAVVAGFFIYRVLRSHPQDVDWLNREQKTALTKTLSDEEALRRRGGLATPLKLLRSGSMWYYGLVYCLIQMSVYAVVFFLPAEVSAILGKSIGVEVGFLSALPWLCALAAAFWIPRVAEKRSRHRLFGGLMLFASALATLLFTSSSAVLAMLGLCVAAAGFIAVQPLFWILPMNYLADDAAAAGFAAINTAGAVGSFLAPNLKVWADTHFGSAMAGLLLMAMFSAVGACLMLFAPQRRL
jgi:MFS family permease